MAVLYMCSRTSQAGPFIQCSPVTQTRFDTSRSLPFPPHLPPICAALGSADVFHANMIAREMIMSMGMGKRMGPVDLMHTTSTSEDTGMMLRTADSAAPNEEYFYHASDMSTEQVRVVLT